MLCGISPAFAGVSPTEGKVAHVLRTRSPCAYILYCYRMLRIRLACVKHAASVRSEPGSNSRLNPVLPNSPATRHMDFVGWVCIAREFSNRGSGEKNHRRTRLEITLRPVFSELRGILIPETRLETWSAFCGCIHETACRGNGKRTFESLGSQMNQTGSGMYLPIVKEQTRDSKRAS